MSLFVVMLLVLSAFVSLSSVARIGQRSFRHSLAWTLAAAVSLISGAWAVHLLDMQELVGPFPLGYHPLMLLAAWMIAVVVGLLGWLLVTPDLTRPYRMVTGSALLAGGVFAVHSLSFMAPGFQPGLAWHAPALAQAAAGTWLLFLVALMAVGVRKDVAPWPWVRQPVATVLLALGVWWSHQLTMEASALAEQTGSSYAHTLSAHALALLAGLGTAILLLMIWITSYTESRLRQSLQQVEGTLERSSQTDGLTGLPNRHYMEERLTRAANQADLDKRKLAMLFVDLDGFKPINESFGHRFGDLLLKETAQRLQAHVGPGVEAARWAADEFLILVDRNDERDAVALFARMVLNQLKQPYLIEGREVPVPASIGIAIYPQDGAQSTLVTHAEAATRVAKSAGGDTYCFFEPHMMRDAREQMELLRDLRQAITDGQFELYYQPKVHAPSGQITGAEALLRWNHPVRGLISPAEFIPVAERFGLIGAIGDWVIGEACRQIREWRDGGLRMRVAINLSVHQLRQKDLGERIAAALALYDVNPKLLTCEITESVAMEDGPTTRSFFDRLETAGVHISIDDFGTGYSSLSYLRQLPTEELKIDKSFVVDLETSNDARAVVDAVVKLGLALGMKVVAEGVETEAQYQILRQLGCDELQGYLFAKPMGAKMLFLWATMEKGPTDLDFRASLFSDTHMPFQDGDALETRTPT